MVELQAIIVEIMWESNIGDFMWEIHFRIYIFNDETRM